MSRTISLLLALATVGSGCRDADAPLAIRVAGAFAPDPDAISAEPADAPPRVEWRFDAAEGGTPLAGWAAARDVTGLAAQEGKLAGRTTGQQPVLRVERTMGPFDADLLHAIEVRISVSAGTTLRVMFDAEEKVDVGAVLDQAQTFPERAATTPLLPGDQTQTYTLHYPMTIAASQIRHVLLQPTDAADSDFELESLRLIFRREHLAGIPAGISWQGLGGIFMETLVTRSPDVIEVELSLPSRPWLDLAVGTVDEGAVTFRVEVAPAGAEALGAPVLERTVTTPDRWESVPLDLSTFAGESVRLAFSVRASREGAIGFWGSPVVRDLGALSDSTRPQGVILIWADTLRFDHLEAYGYGRETAPRVAAMAREGALFRNCVTQATWTKVSTPSLLTSLYPTSHGVKALLDRIPASATTLAEIYQRAGYATFSYASNNFTGKFTNLHQGFDVVHEEASISEAKASKTARIGMDRLFAWLEPRRDVSFFAFLSILDPHDPYEPLPPYDSLWADPAKKAEHRANLEKTRPHIADGVRKAFGMPSGEELRAAGVSPDEFIAHDRDWYDGSIRGMDAEIARMFERLRTLGLDERTMVVFTSDHGEEFLEHGRMFHGQSAYGELNRAPLILRWPAGLSAGLEIDAAVEIIDLMPTLLELSGLPAPEEIQGRSLVPLLEGGAGAWDERPVITEKWTVPGVETPELASNSFAIVEGGWKLIHNFERPEEVPEFELYAFVDDPLDGTDVAADHPDVVARLSEELSRWRARAESQLLSDADAAESLSAEELERLRALGYIE